MSTFYLSIQSIKAGIVSVALFVLLSFLSPSFLDYSLSIGLKLAAAFALTGGNTYAASVALWSTFVVNMVVCFCVGTLAWQVVAVNRRLPVRRAKGVK